VISKVGTIDGRRVKRSEDVQGITIDYPPSMAQRMGAPRLVTRDATSISIRWDKVEQASGFRVRFRREDDPEWSPLSSTMAVLSGEMVRKKNLVTGTGYFFSVQPVTESEWSWSPASERLVPEVSLSPFMTQLFPSTLVSKSGTIRTAEALQGKVVGVYFSASWCGPCRQYTPLLADVYSKSKGKPFEIVFVSADHSEEDFRSYYNDHHPWLAMAYDDPSRESFMAKFSVRGIPRLCILKPSGEILVDNVGPITASAVDNWISQCKL
jgi:thiol-disulfide isomerase/thioredoxin